MAIDDEADYLIWLIYIQAVTRAWARKVVLGENPLGDKIAEGLLVQIWELQRVDPLYSEVLCKLSDCSLGSLLELGYQGRPLNPEGSHKNQTRAPRPGYWGSY